MLVPPNQDEKSIPFGTPDGGFSRLHLSYPSPHIVRRNFKLRAFTIPLPLFANTSFSAVAIEALLILMKWHDT